MPRPASTKKKIDKQNVEFIVRGSSPLYSALSVLSFLLVASAIALQYIELTTEYGFPAGIFFK
jgi:hypothetical protein